MQLGGTLTAARSALPLLVLAALLCTHAAARDLGKTDSLKDAIHTAVSDAVRKHCVPEKQPSDGARCVAECPEQFTACAGRCYSLQLVSVDYGAAERRCEELNSTLAVPRTAAENLCTAGLSGGRRVWLGVTDRHSEGRFEAEDGTPLGLLHGHRWAATQPDDYRGVDPEGEDCLEMVAATTDFGAWNDESCRSQLLPLCQLRD
ncbi:Alpha-N-acetylgalactosamine-specific lectin [Amphibalanus amphitrite]|uniref:Alpha-N-acetylgalactosamine-specific lectin n=1 Tax=Amphibalanus amphitrite TaxID=1232801 RepID=A0A6A4VHS2_AMPAM|nr:alpha-N-acetylgalactosamine-specific lectin-like [Amphibalanus amphitrite]KAF0293133.1 Alpha-N-acetylgalactosamine-specific lectin [Amphibalanus amphitrite]